MSKENLMGDSNGATDTSGSTDTDNGVNNVLGDDTAKIVYPEGFPEEYKGNEALSKYVDKETNVLDVNKALIGLTHAQKLIGQDKIPLPSKDAGEAEWNNVYRKLGLPEKVEDYKIDIEGLSEEDQSNLQGFIETAHKTGVLPHQAKEIINYFSEYAKTQDEQFTQQTEQQYQEQVESLKTEWGDSFQANATIATKAIESFADETTIKEMNEAGYFADPRFTKFMYSIGKQMMDDESLEGIRGAGFHDAGQIKQQYQESYGIIQQGAKHPQYNYHRERLQKLVAEAGKRKISLV